MRGYLSYFKAHPYFGLNCLLLLLAAIFLRVYQLDRMPGINGDEAYTTVQMLELSHSKPVDLNLPTHRTLSPIYGNYVLAVESLLKGFSFWNVRAPALVAGISLILFSFLFLNWALGLPRALIASLLILSHPMHIAYSRSAVEQSLMGLAALFPIYFAFEGSWISSVLALGLGVVIHPLNVFLAPMVFLPLWTTVRYRKIKPTTLFFLGVGSLAGVFVLLKQLLPSNEGFANIFSAFGLLIAEPKFFFVAFLKFNLYFIRLLTGFSAYEYFAGAPSRTLATIWDLSFLLGGLSLIGFGLRRCLKENLRREIYFLIGLGLSLLLLFIVGGPKSLSVGLSRYGVFLIVPSAIATAILLPTVNLKTRAQVFWSISLLSWIFVFHFWTCYFISIHKTGGGYTHRTYATGPVEPKAAIFDWILRESASKSGKSQVYAQVFAEDWWIYWPLRYLSLPHPEIEVVEVTKEMTGAQFSHLLKPGSFAIGFPGGPIWNHFHQRFSSDYSLRLKEFQPPSYSKTQILTAWRYLGQQN